MDIRQQIWEARNAHFNKNRHDPTIVIMTPKNYAELIRELAGDQRIGSDMINGELTQIFGLEPFRSHDVEQNKFIIK